MALQDDLDDATVERLLQSERQLREAQEVAGIGSWQWDMRTDTITWSQNLYRIFGLEPDAFEATFDAYMASIHPDDTALAGQVVQQAMETLQPYSFDHRIIWPDGTVRWVHGQGAVETEDGKPVRMYGVAQDITEQRAASEAKERIRAQQAQLDHLEELNEARSTMLHTLAHEMNTPLTPMRMQAKLLQLQKFGELNAQQERAIGVLDRNLKRLAALIGDMLDVARVQDGQLRLDPKPTDLQDVVRSALDAFRAEADAKKIKLAFDGEPVEANVDPSRLTQVAFNLVSNAIKFSNPGDTIHIRLRADDDILLEVEDPGVGMDPSAMTALFEPFSRLDPDPDRPGNGLGLHICQGIIEQHGGTLTAHSDGKGTGSRFTIRLPLQLPAIVAP